MAADPPLTYRQNSTPFVQRVKGEVDELEVLVGAVWCLWYLCGPMPEVLHVFSWGIFRFQRYRP